jgi:hypothetical protein
MDALGFSLLIGALVLLSIVIYNLYKYYSTNTSVTSSSAAVITPAIISSTCILQYQETKGSPLQQLDDYTKNIGQQIVGGQKIDANTEYKKIEDMKSNIVNDAVLRGVGLSTDSSQKYNLKDYLSKYMQDAYNYYKTGNLPASNADTVKQYVTLIRQYADGLVNSIVYKNIPDYDKLKSNTLNQTH